MTSHATSPNSARIKLTPDRIKKFTLPAGEKAQAFLRDSEVPGLLVRVSNTGAKTFAFESRFDGKTVRIAIGDVAAWDMDKVRDEARRLRRLMDAGTDPRQEKADTAAAKIEAEKQAQRRALTVGALWPMYELEGKPKRKDAFKPRYLADLKAMASAGGVKKKRGAGLTRPGPIYPLLALRLVDITEDRLKTWYDREAIAGKHQAARALMVFRGFLRWAATKPEYRALVDRDAGKAPAIVENLPATKRRTDQLEAAQVSGWWQALEREENTTTSTYLRALLLTGARREELAALTWADVDFQWKRLTIADKVDATRTVPLTPYVAKLLAALPRTNAFVFAVGEKGRINDPRTVMARALKAAGIQHLTLHGLRRSYSLLGEAAGAPAGAIAQIMGHRPSAVAEGYRPRTLDQLRPYADQVEKYITDLAGAQVLEEPEQAGAGLRLVA